MEIFVIALVVLGVAFFVWEKRKGGNTSSSVPSPAPAPAPVADANGNGITSKAELKTLTKNQLIEFAEKRNLKVKKSGTKAAVINEIHTQLK